MSKSDNKLLVVVAAGPLIGVSVAALFASRGFTHIALLSRDAKRLQQDAQDAGLSVGDHSNVVVKTYAADVSIPENLAAALQKVEADFGAPEVVLYNGTRISAAKLSSWDEWSEADLIYDFKVNSLPITTFLWIVG